MIDRERMIDMIELDRPHVFTFRWHAGTYSEKIKACVQIRHLPGIELVHCPTCSCFSRTCGAARACHVQCALSFRALMQQPGQRHDIAQPRAQILAAIPIDHKATYHAIQNQHPQTSGGWQPEAYTQPKSRYEMI